jgi:hypothetical protein
MVTTKKIKSSKKKTIAEGKREARVAQQAAGFEKAKAAMTHHNQQHFDKVIAAKNNPKSTAFAVPKVTLSAEREQQLAEINQRDEAEKAILMDWGQRLQKTHKQVSKLNSQYRDLLYGFLQEAYAVYKEAQSHELADSLFANVRGALLKLGIKIQSNTPDASLIVRLVFGADASAKSVSEYGKVMQAAVDRGVKSDKFAEWLKQETLTKVLADQRAVETETETPKDRLDRARRVILRLFDIREAKPIITHSTTAHAAEKMLGRHYGLCVAIGHASRRMDRENFYADVNLSMVLPVSLDFEIYIVDKLARYIIKDVELYESKIDSLSESVWADELYERLVSAGDEEIEANNEFWSNRQQAQLYEDQQEFLRMVAQRKKIKITK